MPTIFKWLWSVLLAVLPFERDNLSEWVFPVLFQWQAHRFGVTRHVSRPRVYPLPRNILKLVFGCFWKRTFPVNNSYKSPLGFQKLISTGASTFWEAIISHHLTAPGIRIGPVGLVITDHLASPPSCGRTYLGKMCAKTIQNPYLPVACQIGLFPKSWSNEPA